VLWIQNPNDEPVEVMSCGDIGWFWIDEVEVLDSGGTRVMSRREERDFAERKRNPKSFVPPVAHYCNMNVPITIPAHACKHGSFSNPNNDFVQDLNQYYTLPPGQYFVSPLKRDGGRFVRTNIKLPITVLKP
jgi:hypothetical protein